MPRILWCHRARVLDPTPLARWGKLEHRENKQGRNFLALQEQCKASLLV